MESTEADPGKVRLAAVSAKVRNQARRQRPSPSTLSRRSQSLLSALGDNRPPRLRPEVREALEPCAAASRTRLALETRDRPNAGWLAAEAPLIRLHSGCWRFHATSSGLTGCQRQSASSTTRTARRAILPKYGPADTFT